MPEVLEFKSKGKRRTKKDEGEVIDHGTIGGLHYDVFKRGVIHIKDKVSKCFKKDIDQFEECLDSFDFDDMGDGEEFFIAGSGDNDDLIFLKKDGEIHLSLKKKNFSVVEKLKNIVKKYRR